MDEHNLRAIPMSAELIKRTQATLLALAKTVEAMDSDEGLQRLAEKALEGGFAEPPEKIHYAAAAISACMEYWIMSGYYTRAQLTEMSAIIMNAVKPLPEGPTRRGSHDHC